MNDTERLDWLERYLKMWQREPLNIAVWDLKVFTCHPLRNGSAPTLRDAIELAACNPENSGVTPKPTRLGTSTEEYEFSDKNDLIS